MRAYILAYEGYSSSNSAKADQLTPWGDLVEVKGLKGRYLRVTKKLDELVIQILSQPPAAT